MSRKTAADLAEDMAGLAHDIRTRAMDEVRRDIADELREHYAGATPDAEDHVLSAMRESEPVRKIAQLKGLLDRFEEDGVPADFYAGVAFAAAMLLDKDFDY